MPRRLEKTCTTCVCPTLNAVNSVLCSGWRSADGVIYRIKDCQTWKAAPTKWSVTEAINFSRFAGHAISRPTIIKLVTAYQIGRQLDAGTRYRVNAERFKQLLARLLGEDQ